VRQYTIPPNSAIRRLCFGGSFNPVHHAHLICARAVAEAKGFDKVVLIPSALSPHKLQTNNLTAPMHRLAMCKLAVEGEPFFEVDDVEVTRRGPSYTIDTVRLLRKRGWDEVFWLIGADLVPILPTWHEADTLLQEVHFLVMARPGWSFNWQSMPPAYRRLEQNVVPAPLIEISSTNIRQRIAERKSIAYLTPRAVSRYVEENTLYRLPEPP
jgi:nicotinate-nucleotide adenylyltransferase